MHPALEAAYAKRDRAREHLETLEDETDEFLRGYPYRMGLDLDLYPGWYTAHLHIVEEPPPRLSILVGEIAYECLSALNHLVWELAARKQGRHRVVKFKRTIQFPVSHSERHFVDQGLVKQRLISKPALAAIEGLQPYKRFGYAIHSINSPLGWIKEIADADKHRELARGFGQLRFDEIGWDWDETRASGPIVESLLGEAGGAIEDRAPVSRIRFGSGHNDAHVNVDRQPGADVLFSTDTWSLNVVHMEAACVWLDRIALKSLAPLFPG